MKSTPDPTYYNCEKYFVFLKLNIFSFMCMFCRSLLVLLSFFFWPLCCLYFFDIRILFTPLVSSNSSYNNLCLILMYFRQIRITMIDWLIYHFTYKSSTPCPMIVLSQNSNQNFWFLLKYSSFDSPEEETMYPQI